MLSYLKKAVIAVVAAGIFFVTAVIGAIAGFAGAFVRSQVPEQADPNAAIQDTSSESPASPTHRPPKRLPHKGVR